MQKAYTLLTLKCGCSDACVSYAFNSPTKKQTTSSTVRQIKSFLSDLHLFPQIDKCYSVTKLPHKPLPCISHHVCQQTGQEQVCHGLQQSHFRYNRAMDAASLYPSTSKGKYWCLKGIAVGEQGTSACIK
jgi:hypothetical protein